MELCTRGLGTSISTLKSRGVNLSSVRILCVIAEERPRIQLTQSFSKLFSALGLSPRVVSTSFGCRVDTGICLQVWSAALVISQLFYRLFIHDVFCVILCGSNILLYFSFTGLHCVGPRSSSFSDSRPHFVRVCRVLVSSFDVCLLYIDTECL